MEYVFSGREVFKLEMHTYEIYFILKGLRNLGIKKCLVSQGYILTISMRNRYITCEIYFNSSILDYTLIIAD